MKTLLLAVSLSVLTCACTPPADKPVTALADAPVVAGAAPAPANPASAADKALPAAAVAPGVPAHATGASAGEQAVNDAIDSKLGDHTKYRAAIDDLQAAVAAGDGVRVAALAHYPFSVTIAGKAAVLKNEREFAARYQDFMTPGISKAIVETKYRDLFVNYKGVMFGDGQAWLNGICKDKLCKTFEVRLVALQHGPD